MDESKVTLFHTRGGRKALGLPVTSGHFVLCAGFKYDIVTLPRLQDGEVSYRSPAFFMPSDHNQHFMAHIISNEI